MIHQRVDVERWNKLFPLEKLRKEAREFVERRHKAMPDQYKSTSEVERHVQLMSPGGEIITSPKHLAVVEQLRKESLGSRNLPAFHTDVFVFARGEPSNRSVTKIGGLPFWPKRRDWPVGKSGNPMSFVAQFCFADSMDLFDSLPGEILLIFSDGIYGKDWTEGDTGAIRFEWVNRSESNLVEAEDIPLARWGLFPVYGEIHRTQDYVTDLSVQRALKAAYKCWYQIAVAKGTKIGGLPPWIQDVEEIPGRFLCALGSVHPDYQLDEILLRPYPFTNFQEPLVRRRGGFRAAGEEIQADRLLMWGDVGSLFLFLDDADRIHWTTQCY